MMVRLMFDFCPEHHGHEDHSARSQAFGRIALNKMADAFRPIWTNSPFDSKEPNFTMQSGSCTSCTCTFFFHFRDLSLLDKLGSLARWVATVFSTWLWSTSMVQQLQHHRSRLWVVPRKSHQDSFYLVPSKASNLDHSTCSMHIMYREHLCFLFDMHVVEYFSAWKAFSCSEIVFFSQEQASLVQEDHGDNHGAEHGGCLGFHWNHGVFVLLHFDLSDSFLHVQSQGKSRIHCCFNMLFLLRTNVGKESDSNVSRRRTCRFTWCWAQVKTPAASMTHQEFLCFFCFQCHQYSVRRAS